MPGVPLPRCWLSFPPRPCPRPRPCPPAVPSCRRPLPAPAPRLHAGVPCGWPPRPRVGGVGCCCCWVPPLPRTPPRPPPRPRGVGPGGRGGALASALLWSAWALASASLRADHSARERGWPPLTLRSHRPAASQPGWASVAPPLWRFHSALVAQRTSPPRAIQGRCSGRASWCLALAVVVVVVVLRASGGPGVGWASGAPPPRRRRARPGPSGPAGLWRLEGLWPGLWPVGWPCVPACCGCCCRCCRCSCCCCRSFAALCWLLRWLCLCSWCRGGWW